MLKIFKKLFGPRAVKMTAGDVAKKFGLEIHGDPSVVISGVAPIADAKSGDIAFYSTEKTSEAFKILPIDVLKNTKASVILLQPDQVKHAPKRATLLIAESPRGNIVKILGEIYKEPPKRGIDWTARIAKGVYFRKKKTVYIGQFATIEKGAVIESNVHVGPSAYIGKNVTIGANTIIYDGAHIENATIGANCVIYPNAVIGKDGFGYTRQDGKNIFIPHVGRVVLGNRVSVGACSCIDRGLMTDTTIGEGTKIDNLCQIAHGVIIGKECFLASNTGIAGGVVAGDRVLFAGKVGIANGVKIGDDAEIGANSGVMRDIGPGEKILGYPATNAMEFMRMTAWTRKNMRK